MPFHIKGKIQHYKWGGYDFLPRLLDLPNPGQEPFAEYWLGAHTKAPSEVWKGDQQKTALNKLIQSDPVKYLGKETAGRFGRLPYLFKILDVREMLSIQVHPSKSEAEKGFAGENEQSIPLDAPDRNYKDDNHKPEMMVALSPFYLLHGFRTEADLRQILNDVPELKPLYTLFDEKEYKGLYSHVMTMPQEEVNRMLGPLLSRLLPLYEQNKLDKNHPDYWAAKALATGMTNINKIDRGIFSIYFLNLLLVQPGESTFQDAGILHAYLEGQNIELMANSDNVLRGGLTSKHVDVGELLKHVRFEGHEPEIRKSVFKQEGEWAYPCPVKDFALTKMEPDKDEMIEDQCNSMEIFLLISGKISFEGNEAFTIHKGEAALMTFGEKYKLTAIEKALIYKASVPVD